MVYYFQSLVNDELKKATAKHFNLEKTLEKKKNLLQAAKLREATLLEKIRKKDELIKNNEKESQEIKSNLEASNEEINFLMNVIINLIEEVYRNERKSKKKKIWS